MSLTSDVLTRATPRRLICRGGRWVLELSRLEAVDRDVFQPRLTRLEGSDAILAALRRSEDGQHLASGAAQLMRGPRSDDDRAFEVSDGDWVPSADASLPAARGDRVEADLASDQARALAELRAELAVLRASHSRLCERVIALEASQSGLAQPGLRQARGSRASSRRKSEPPPAFAVADAGAEPLASPAAFAATQASPGLATPPAPASPPKNAEAAASDGVAAVQSFDDLARAVAGVQPLPVVVIPGLPSLMECLTTLLGAPPPVEKTGERPFAYLDRPQLCKLLDDEGRERGAIVLELKAAVLLGAGLLALPRNEALRQIKENDPSEDALLAMSEICNNLTGPINAVAKNQHLRSTALTAADISSLPTPRARLDLAVEGAHMAIVMF